MTSSLANLVRSGGPLKPEDFNPQETAGLIKSGMARLHDADVRELSLESKFDLAYNAAHALCLAGLRYSGYRPNHRYIVFQAVPHTLGLGPEVWRILARAHDIRNLAEYEGHLEVEGNFVEQLVGAVMQVVSALDELGLIENK